MAFISWKKLIKLIKFSKVEKCESERFNIVRMYDGTHLKLK